MLPCGTVKLEIGDDHVLTLTPRENRALGELMAGAAQQFAGIQLGHEAAHMANELQQQIRQLRQELKAVRGELATQTVSDDLEAASHA